MNLYRYNKEILRVLTACQPKGFILENVEGLARMAGGETLELIVGRGLQSSTL